MNIRLYLGAVTFPLQVKLWVHTVQMLAKTRVVTNGQINFRLIESEIDLTDCVRESRVFNITSNRNGLLFAIGVYMCGESGNG